jgi:ribose/xylose/arabinose/galactoside ABC-type transport system permease subunit
VLEGGGSVFVALGLLWIVLALASPYFLTTNNLLNLLLQSSTIGILAAGFTIVLIAGEVDLSFASIQALATTLAAVLIISHRLPIVVGIAVVLGMGLVAGVINGYMTVAAKLPSFIATLAMLGVAQGLAFVLTGARTIGGFPDAYAWLGRGKLAGVPVPVYFAVAVYLLMWFVLSQTRFGIKVYAVGGGREASRLAGLRPGRIVMMVFIIAGVLSALAGVLLSAQLNAGQGNFGTTDLLNAIAAVIIGGTSLNGGLGSVVGTAAGVLTISTINNGLVLIGVSTFWIQVVVGLIILAAVLTDKIVKGELRLRDLAPGAALR